MKRIFFLVMVLVLKLFAEDPEDPRMYMHGISVVEYIDNNEYKYMATWSSDLNPSNWEHDIFRKNFHFEYGDLHEDVNRKYLIQAREAQEPVHTVVIPNSKTFISVWEDGYYNNSDKCPNNDKNDCVEIHARIYNTDNPVVSEDGFTVDSFSGNGENDVAVTHAPTVSYVQASDGRDLFVVTYAEEPRNGLPRIKVRIYNKNGQRLSLENGKGKHLSAENDSVYLTNNGNDNWWPVSISDNDKRVFIAWQRGYKGKDYVNVNGCVLTVDATSNGEYRVNCQHRGRSKYYLKNIKEYSYSVAYLDSIKKFILIGAKYSSNRYSRVALINSEDGYRDNYKSRIKGSIVREAQIATKREQNEDNFSVDKVVYPSTNGDIVSLKIKDGENGLSIVTSDVWHENLNNVSWPTTGIASLFIKDNDGQDSWGEDREEDRLVFFFPDENGQLKTLPVAIDKF